MDSEIIILEKPDWVSWDDIHELLWEAHTQNRKNGVIMKYPSLPGEEIKKRIEGKGLMLVAMKGKQLIGTSALIVKNMSLWCGKGEYAYFCFDSVAPEFQGKGVYKQLNQKRERMAKKLGMSRLLLDTNEGNGREINVVKKAGFKNVAIKRYDEHFNVVFVKWLEKCPYSNFRCEFEFIKQKIKLKAKTFLHHSL